MGPLAAIGMNYPASGQKSSSSRWESSRSAGMESGEGEWLAGWLRGWVDGWIDGECTIENSMIGNWFYGKRIVPRGKCFGNHSLIE